MTAWAAFLIAAGIGTALALRHAAPLTEPISCLGVLELIAIISSRTWRDVPLGSILTVGNSALLGLALLLLARVVHGVTANVFITIAITVAAAASAEFAYALAPAPAGAILITIAAWVAILRARQGSESTGARVGPALGLLALLAAVATSFTIPAAILAVWLAWDRGIARAALAAAIAIAPSMAVQLALTQAPASYLACVVPQDGWSSLLGAGRAFASIMTANPLVTALAALGVLAMKRLPGGVAQSLLPMSVIALWGGAVIPAPSAGAVAPFVIVFWLLAAAGLTDVWNAASRTASGRAGVFALAIAVVVFQVVNLNFRRETSAPADGHEQLTLAMMSAIVGALPRGAGLVEEDAVADLLTRSLPGRLRTPDRFHVVRRDAEAVTSALNHAPVFALPRSQRVLQHLGFELAEPTAAVPGLAQVKLSHPCTELGSTPTAFPLLTGRQAFSLVANDDRARDRVAILLASDAPLSATPVNWPPEAMRGMHGRMFDLTVAMDQRDFAEELRYYELPSWPDPQTRYVTRIEAWRTPGAPLVLPILLGGTASLGLGRGLGSSPGQGLRICPSIPYDVRPLARRP